MAVQYAFGKIVTQGLDLNVDAANSVSYPGTGLIWTDTLSRITGSLTGSISYTSEFYGGLTFINSSSAVIFPNSVANYDTNTFVVEMAFKPTFINGRHYLMSKNSGSFPNWAIYLSGSSGQGKLWSEFRTSAAISCSVSSTATFTTGSVYQVDIRITPALSASFIYVNGQYSGGAVGNGGGTLTNTASLFVGNFSQNNTQNFSGSIYNIKLYNRFTNTQITTNLNVVSSRFGFNQRGTSSIAPINVEYLVVGGGGSGGTNGVPRYETAGGGAGGLLTGSISILEENTVIVGDGGNGTLVSGSNGNNSVFGNIIAFGGGAGGSAVNGVLVAGSGGSGGGSITSAGPSGSGIPGQGNNGALSNFSGGGGAGTIGIFNNGGSGSFVSAFATIGGSPAGWFAGGGGGYIGRGGIGGGASGSSNLTVYTGSINTGGGGGGFNAGSFTPSAGGKGGSGIVSIRYVGPSILFSGGEITSSGSYVYHTFRSPGTYLFIRI
jgi:hypothetical protein